LNSARRDEHAKPESKCKTMGPVCFVKFVTSLHRSYFLSLWERTEVRALTPNPLPKGEGIMKKPTCASVLILPLDGEGQR
jgi:hypothetical protein